MGRSIDLYSYDYEKLVNKIMGVAETQEREMVDKILLACGNKIHDRYVLLNQEMWDGYSCYYNVMSTLDKVLKTEDIGDVFYDKNVDREELISSVDKYDILEELGIEDEED